MTRSYNSRKGCRSHVTHAKKKYARLLRSKPKYWVDWIYYERYNKHDAKRNALKFFYYCGLWC